jgi:outer membrane biosynthesis protein TonB
MTPPAPNKGHKRDYRVAIIVGVVLLAAGYGIASVVGGSEAPRKRVMETVAIKILPPPPPPKTEPPPPPPKLIEPPKMQPPMDKPPDEPKPADAPPPGPLALDAKGGAGSDSFGLGGKPGGADFTGGGGSRFGHYKGLIHDQIQRWLRDYAKLAGAKYNGTVRIRLTSSGGIEGVEILHGTGDRDLDGVLQQALSAMPALPEAPPAEMPTVVNVRVSSAGNST